MDELTLLRSTRENREPSPEALAAARTALLERAADESSGSLQGRRRIRTRPPLRRRTVIAAVAAAAVAGVLVAGTIDLTVSKAYATDVLRAAASATGQYADLVPGSGQYLRSHTHARWEACSGDACVPNDQIIDVYMPADPAAEWVLYRDWGNRQGGPTQGLVETLRAAEGRFYNPKDSWLGVDFAEIPADGQAAYEWIDAQYNGGSASRDENNFVRIMDILRSGLVPAVPRAALLDALTRIPGVTATDRVANLDGVKGVGIGRSEPFRAGARLEVIIDPDTGLVIGERELFGATLFGWRLDREASLTAMETTIVDSAP